VKIKAILIVALLLFSVASAGAVEWNSKLGVSVHGPFFAPLFKGSKYAGPNNGGSSEPFMLGWDPAFEIKYGIPKSFIIDLSIGFNSTYDDMAAPTDQSFKLNNKDHAYSKLNGIALGLTGQYYFLAEGSVQPYLLIGAGIDMWTMKALTNLNNQIPIGSKYKFTDLVGKGGAGINFWITDNIAFDLQGKLTYALTTLSSSGPQIYGDLSKSANRPFSGYIEPSIGITYFFGGSPDSDKDGVKDKFDQCPDTPRGAIVDQYGCPLDSDGDGVYDGIDLCPDTRKGCVVDITGCPLDTDKDGVCDGLDKCPDTPAGVAVDVRGCPLDSDGDGVPDYLDKQPNTPKGAVVDSIGVAIDSDGDGVPDGIDKCPDTPANVLVDDFGCPRAKALTEKLILNIQYESGSFDPDTAAKTILNDLVVTMGAYPKLKIQINGYTDALGSNSGNLKISQKRADALRDYLLSKGIAVDRMTSQGFGEADPISDNGTEDGRQRNRRIEIVPVEE
jgi:OmpA-OmpF porin, OOP family